MFFPARSKLLKRFTRSASASSRGARPVTCRTARRSVPAFELCCLASSERRTPSSEDSERYFAARATSAAEAAISFGRQRRQGRKPCFSACSPVEKKMTFCRNGRRAGQDGRQ